MSPPVASVTYVAFGKATFNSAAAKGIKAAQAKYPNISVSIRENTGMAQSEAALVVRYVHDGTGGIVLVAGVLFALFANLMADSR